MSDERFFTQVKSTLHNYSPEVASDVYSGMRRKLWWSNFTKLGFARFNMWYLLLLIAAGGSIAVWQSGSEATDNAAVYSQPTETLEVVQEQPSVSHEAIVTFAGSNESSSCAGKEHQSCCSASKASCGSEKSASSSNLKAHDENSVQAEESTFENELTEMNGLTNPSQSEENNAVVSNETETTQEEAVVEQPVKKSRKGKSWKVKVPASESR